MAYLSALLTSFDLKHSGILREPSISSETAMILVFIRGAIFFNAFVTTVVQEVSPKVRVWGKPEGPYPVSDIFFIGKFLQYFFCFLKWPICQYSD
jgi:hypothetical protein